MDIRVELRRLNYIFAANCVPVEELRLLIHNGALLDVYTALHNIILAARTCGQPGVDAVCERLRVLNHQSHTILVGKCKAVEGAQFDARIIVRDPQEPGHCLVYNTMVFGAVLSGRSGIDFTSGLLASFVEVVKESVSV